jgi:phage terminase small subunit
VIQWDARRKGRAGKGKGQVFSQLIMSKDKLTDKQAMFVKEYLVDLNATQAAIRAGYSENTANVIGPENLAKPCIAKEIQKHMDKRSKRLEITADTVLQEIAKLGYSNIQKIYKEDGTLIPVHELPPEVAATITEVNEEVIKVDGESVTMKRKYKIADKGQNLERLGRHLKLFTDKVDVNLATVVRKKKRFDGD